MRLTSKLGFPCGSVAKESACNVGDLGSIPGLDGSPGEGKGYPLPYSGHGMGSNKLEGEKAGLKLNIQKTKIMASSPITSWQIDAEATETVTNSIFGGSKITADGDCSHRIKRHLLLGSEHLICYPRQHVKNQRHYFTNKCPDSLSYGFFSSHVWM